MFRGLERRILTVHHSRRLTAMVAGLVVLVAIAVSSAQPPTASAQLFGGFGFNGLGNYYGGFGGLGYGGVGYGGLGYGLGYGGYGLGYGGYGGYGGFPFNYSTVNPYTPYGYAGYYGLNNGLYGYGNGLGGYTGYNPYGLYGSYGQGVTYANTGAVYGTTTTVTGVYGAPMTFSAPGRYCTDKSGGQVWEPQGAPTDALAC